jgi:hypothetical protein
MQQFDPNIPGLITGEITTVLVRDPANTFPPFEVGNHVIDSDEDFQVRVTWELDGLLATLWLAALEAADWDVSVYAESMGGGNEVRLGTETVEVDPAQHAYEATIDVSGGQLQEHTPGTDIGGVYKLVVAVFLNSNLGSPGYDITGFSEGPYIQVEDPQ